MTGLARGTYRTTVHVRNGTPTQPGPKLATLHYGYAPTLYAAQIHHAAVLEAIKSVQNSDPVCSHPLCAVLKAMGPCYVERVGFETPLKEDC